MQIAEIYEARIVDATPTSLLVEATGAESKIDALIAMLRGYGIREMVRSGQLAMVRGGPAAASNGAGPVASNGREDRVVATAVTMGN